MTLSMSTGLKWKSTSRQNLRVKQNEAILHYLYKVAAKLQQLHITSSIRHNISLLTASQVVESKVDKGKTFLWHWHRCLEVSTTSKA